MPNDAPGAASSEDRQQLPYGLLTIDEILEHTKARQEYTDTVDVDAAIDLSLRYEQVGDKQGGFLATVPVRNKDGTVQMKDLPLSDSAVKTGCRLIKGTPEFFAESPDPDAFPKWFRNVMDKADRKQRGMIVRHDGMKINAILPRNYLVKDAYDLLSEFLPALQENVGDIRGVLGLEPGNGDIASYRIVMGNNIMPSLAQDQGQFLMFNINTSEAGLIDTKTSLGLYRTFCTNSAIRTQTLSKWDHKTPFAPFYDKAAKTIRESGYLRSHYGKIFEEMLNERLPFPALDLLNAFKREQLITNNHFESAAIHAQASEVINQYDLFNVLTRSAQDLPSIQARERAEEAAMKLFTETGGVIEALRRAEGRQKRNIN